MNILITAPSLNPSQNISGISSIVQLIVSTNKEHTYFHYLLGRADKPTNKLHWLLKLIRQLLFFPLVLKYRKINLVHQNLPLDPKGILREYLINSWCKLFRIPVVIHIHGGQFITSGTDNKLLTKLTLSIFEYAKQVIVLSELEKEVLANKFNYSKAIVLSNCIDNSLYNTNSSFLPTPIPTLLYLGRIEKNKGISELIEAIIRLKKVIDFRFVLCGNGNMADECSIACKSILGSNFEYRGVVSGKEKIDIIKQSTLFILPSYFEGLPMALLETMAAGVVPVVTKVGSMKDIIIDRENGLFVEMYNSQDLFEKINQLLTNKDLLRNLSVNAAKTIAENYTINNYFKQLNQVYQAAI